MSTEYIGRSGEIFNLDLMKGREAAGEAEPCKIIVANSDGPALPQMPDAAPITWPDPGQGGPNDNSLLNIEAFLDASRIVIGFNKFTNKPTLKYLDRWFDIDDHVLRALAFGMRKHKLSPSKEFLFDAVMFLAMKRKHHPVLEYLEHLQWDRTPRLDTWLSVYGGAPDTELNRAYGRCHLMAAVARVHNSGVKKDEMLVLRGPQGCGKSSAIKTLAVREEWHDDSLQADWSAKLVMETMTGKWISEYAELDGLGKKAAGKVKAMLSRQNDYARMAYDKLQSNYPRQFVMFGSTNQSAYLVDDTGNRRFWCVDTPKFDIPALRRDRDQIWAEAVHRYEQGEDWRLPEHLWQASAEAAADNMVISPIQEALEDVLEGKSGKVRTDGLYEFLGYPPGARQNRWMAAEVRGHMERLGWTKDRLPYGRSNRKLACYRNIPAEPRGGWLTLSRPLAEPKAEAVGHVAQLPG